MPEKSFADRAGLVLFPRSTADLTSTSTCPACFTKLTSTTCTNCGLDVTHPAATQLHDTALAAAAALDQRVELIGRMRAETVPAPVPAPPVPAAAAAVATAPVVAAPPPAPAAAPLAPAAPRRHFGVQVILLIVGVSLLAIGAIFFLVYAFITFGLVWRSVIIGAVTIAAFIGASLLRRRKLGATAEAIAALAVVFVYLDAFAIRANNLFGAEHADGLVYWGLTLLLSAVGFAVWSRMSGIRLPNLVAFTAVGPGLALLVAGLAQSLPDTTTVFAAFVGLAASGLVHPLAGARMPERVISLALAIAGLLVAGITALLLEPQLDWAPVVGLGIVALLALLHVVVVARVGSPRPLGLVAGAIGAVAASTAMLVVGLRSGDSDFIVIAPLVAAAIVTLALEFTARRLTGFPRSAAVVAAWSAAAVAAIVALFPLVTSLGPVVALMHQASPRWTVSGAQATLLHSENVLAVLALAIVVVLAAAAWLASGILTRRRPALVWAGFAVLLLAVPLLGMLWLVILAWLLLGAAGLAGLLVAAGRGSRASVRVPLAVGGAAATALAYAGSWASIDTWWYGSVGAVVLLVATRLATRATPLRGILVGVATVLAFVAIGSEGWHTNERFQGGHGAPLESAHFVVVLGIVLIGLSAVLTRVLSALETRVLFWLSFATTVVSAGLGWTLTAGAVGVGSLVLPEYVTSIVLAAALVGVLLPWVLRRAAAGFEVERVAASIALAPAAAWLADSLCRQFGAPGIVQACAPVVAALLVAATGLLAPARRWARDAGVGLVAVPAVLVAVFGRADGAWLVVLLAGLTALLLATSRDGLVGSASARKHLGWVALALATASLWWRLADYRVTDLEPYVLPVAGVLLAVAALAWRAARPEPSASAPWLTLAALAIALLPLAVVSGTGPELRAVIVAAVGAALLIAGSLFAGGLSAGQRARPYLDAAALAGALALLIAATGRATALIASGAHADLAADAWLGGLFLVLAAAALALARRRPLIAQVVLGVALVTPLLLLAALDGPYATVRAAVLLAVYCAAYVVGILVDRSPLRAVGGWAALAVAVIVAITAVARGAIDPLEWATAALALALLIVGVVRMRRSPQAGSWAWLAPGLLVLLLPSLFATFLDQPFLRLVALGIACVAAIVWGAVARLQAPLIIGAVVVLVHAIRTFAPQLVAIYQLTEWWVWAVIGGAILLFLGLTFEKRVRDLRSVGTRIAALR